MTDSKEERLQRVAMIGSEELVKRLRDDVRNFYRVLPARNTLGALPIKWACVPMSLLTEAADCIEAVEAIYREDQEAARSQPGCDDSASRDAAVSSEPSGAVTPEFIAASAKAAIRALRGLEETALMLERWAPECFPILPEHDGKAHFARVLMESAAQAIRDAWASAIKEVETLP